MFYEPMVLGSKIENTANFATPVKTWYNIFNKFKDENAYYGEATGDGWQPDGRFAVSFGAFRQYLFPGMELS